jgi:UDP-glucose 4-epimerase
MKKTIITGSSGRIGRALHWKLCQQYEVDGMDISPSSATSVIGDIQDYEQLQKTFEGVDTVFHSAALHAPHVGLRSEKDFYETNVHATEKICKAAIASGVSEIVFTSTTALYGYANWGKEKAVWVNEQTTPQPRTIYHKTKLEAEAILKEYAGTNLAVSVIRMSRCFPEPVQKMAVYRLHRGVDYRDVAAAHILASQLKKKKDYDVYVVSGNTPFRKSDIEELARDPQAVIRKRQPHLAEALDKRNWPFPKAIDRVYDASYASKILGWKSQRGPMDVIKQFDHANFEILPK